MQFLAWGEMERREKEIKNWNTKRERERDNLYRTTFGLVEVGKTYIGVGKKRKKEEGRERKKTNCSRHRMSHTNHESSVRLNYCIPTYSPHGPHDHRYGRAWGTQKNMER